MKKLSLVALGILIAAQLAVPFSMIKSRENILRNGELFRFKTRPIDPADPFQGRYVLLRFDSTYVPLTEEQEQSIGSRVPVYAIVSTNEQGFAYFVEARFERPMNQSYLKTRTTAGLRFHPPGEASRVHIDIPFDRYYMDEAKAPRAERLVRDSTRSTNCWVNVRILDGKAVIEDVFAEGQPLRDLAVGEGG